MDFEFATAQRILFGSGRIAQLPELAKNLGQRVLLLCGSSPERIQPICHMLIKADLNPLLLEVHGEPTVEEVSALTQKARQAGCDLVVAVGGGSVLDAGKAVAALLANPGDPLDYLEVVGKGLPLCQPPKPSIAIPTTAGTGAEVTRNAVLSVPKQRVKVSMRHLGMLPAVVLVDPNLTHSLPPTPTLFTGMDALTQLIEAFVSIKATPFTDAFCREGLKRIGAALPRVLRDGTDREAREDMALSSLLSGLALANGGLGVIHGIAGPLGGMFSVSHGKVCAALLRPACALNIRALQKRAPDHMALKKYTEVAALLSGQPCSRPEDLLQKLDALADSFSLPTLESLEIPATDIPILIEKALQASSMKGNPLQLTAEELAELF